MTSTGQLFTQAGRIERGAPELGAGLFLTQTDDGRPLISSLPIGGALPGEYSLVGLGLNPSDTIDQRVGIQACLDLASTDKKGLFIDPGKWRWTGQLRQYNVPWIRGIPEQSIFQPLGGGVARTSFTFETNNDPAFGTGSTRRSYMQYVSFYGTDLPAGSTLVRCGGNETAPSATYVSARQSIEGCEFNYCAGGSIGIPLTTTASIGLHVANTVGLTIDGSYIGKNDVNVLIDGFQVDLPTTTMIRSTQIREAITDGLVIRSGFGTHLTDMSIVEANGQYGIRGQPDVAGKNMVRCSVDRCWIEANWLQYWLPTSPMYDATNAIIITKYAIFIDGSTPGCTANFQIWNCYQNAGPTRDRFIWMKRVSGFHLENNEHWYNAGSGKIEDISVGRVMNSMLQGGLGGKVMYPCDSSSVVTYGPEYDAPWDGNNLTMWGYHFWMDLAANLRVKPGIPTSDTDGSIVGSVGSAWDGIHFMMGPFHLWIDSNQRLRIKNTPPTSDKDGQFAEYFVPSWNDEHLKLGSYHIWFSSIANEFLWNSVAPVSDTDGISLGNVPTLSSAWNGPHLILGTYHYWVDATGKTRIKNGVPGSDLDGAVLDTLNPKLETVDGFSRPTLGASANFPMLRAGGGVNGTAWLSTSAGSVTKIVARTSAVVTAGSIEAEIYIGGVPSGLKVTFFSGSGVGPLVATMAVGVVPFIEGAYVQINCITSAGFLPTATIGIDAAMQVTYT